MCVDRQNLELPNQSPNQNSEIEIKDMPDLTIMSSCTNNGHQKPQKLIRLLLMHPWSIRKNRVFIYVLIVPTLMMH